MRWLLPILALACAPRRLPDAREPASPTALERAEERCLDALIAARGALEGPLAEAATATCNEAEALRTPRCAEAVLAPPGPDPAADYVRRVAACAAAYCPDLPDPKPSACTGEVPPPGMARLAADTALRAAIYRLESGQTVRMLWVDLPAAPDGEPPPP